MTIDLTLKQSQVLISTLKEDLTQMREEQLNTSDNERRESVGHSQEVLQTIIKKLETEQVPVMN